jgi:hypothetical protein
MDTFIIPPYLFSRPLTSFARQTQTGGEILPPRPAEAKTSIASRYYQCLCLKGMKLLPGQVAQAKSFSYLRVSAVKIFTYLSNTMGIIGSFH